jgi:glycosyltransferase involved in cell wall biosynthesis
VVGSAAGSVSVAIPVFNGSEFLRDAIDSVLGQTSPADEVLVFDNASTDGSADIAVALLGAAAVHVSQVNKGASWNFNRAASEATGEYFAWLGADDRLRPHFLESTVAALDADPAAAGCLTSIAFISPAGQVTGEQRAIELGSADLRRRLRHFLRRYRWTEVYCLYRRQDLLASPMFRDEPGADVTLTWWFLLRGPLVVLESPLLEYRTSQAKSLQDMAESLTAVGRPVRWHKMQLWRGLWRETAHPDLTTHVRRVARQELIMALVGRHWLVHNAADALAQIPSRRTASYFQRVRTWHRKRQGRA